MTGLADFLLARIAEDEAVARATIATAGGEHWIHADDGEVAAPHDLIAHPPRLSYAVHIARHDPARVLAECEAKRLAIQRMIDGPTGSEPWDEGWHVAAEEFAEFLALPYADHPDYREEWRP